MTLLGWIFRLAFFVVLFWFALKNTDPVTLHLGGNTVIEHVPLVVALLGCIVLGAVAGILAMVPTVARLGRRVTQLERRPRADAGEASRTAELLAAAARDAGAVGELDADTRVSRHP